MTEYHAEWLHLKEQEYQLKDMWLMRLKKSAIKISKHNYPQIEHCGDVFEADFTQYKGFDLLVGGSPCTHWSIARAGVGEKSGSKRETTASGLGWDLFSQYVRALNEVKPTYFLYENNVSMSDEIKQRISEQLGCKPYQINSADFSAQIRNRYYWTNIPLYHTKKVKCCLQILLTQMLNLRQEALNSMQKASNGQEMVFL